MNAPVIFVIEQDAIESTDEATFYSVYMYNATKEGLPSGIVRHVAKVGVDMQQLTGKDIAITAACRFLRELARAMEDHLEQGIRVGGYSLPDDTPTLDA